MIEWMEVEAHAKAVRARVMCVIQPLVEVRSVEAPGAAGGKPVRCAEYAACAEYSIEAVSLTSMHALLAKGAVTEPGAVGVGNMPQYLNILLPLPPFQQMLDLTPRRVGSHVLPDSSDYADKQLVDKLL